MLTTIILAISGISLIALISLVLLSNSRARQNRWLSAFMVGGLLWLTANLLANLYQDTGGPHYLIFSRASLVGAAILPPSFLIFCISFVRKTISPRLEWLLSVPALVLFAMTPTSLNISSVSSNDATIHPGVAYPLLLVILITYFGVGIRLLVKEYKTTSDESVRQQLYYILFGVILTLVPGVLLSAVLPLLGVSGAVSFSPAVVIFFSFSTAMAIIRHRLFDIRMFVVRGLIYTVSTLVLSLIYVAPAIYVMMLIFDMKFSLGKFAMALFVATVIATNYGRIKGWFNRTSNRLFFRDAYEPTQLLGELNKILVSTVDLKKLLSKTEELILQEVKPESCGFILKEGGNDKLRFIGVSHITDNSKQDELVDVLKQFKDNVTLTSLLPESSKTKAILTSNNIAVVAKLVVNQGKHLELLGYLLLGERKSGKAYNFMDAQVFNAVANTLVIAIQNALRYEEIENFNITLQQRVEEATRKLRRSNQRLKELDEAKDDFVSMASHQLRTPLTSIKGYTSMVMEGDAGPVNSTQEKLLGQVFASSQRMVFLIADLLNVSRLKTGKFVIEPGVVNLADMVQQEVKQLMETAQSRQLKLTYKKPATFPLMKLDVTKTRQVVMNFIDNAIYYTPAGGHIDVELKETPTMVEFRVIDNGIGVTRDEQPRLFTKFYRAENARKARPDGTGLGLFMSKKVVVGEGGAIIFESQVGKGSTFGFMFPKATLMLDEAAAAKLSAKGTNELA